MPASINIIAMKNIEEYIRTRVDEAFIAFSAASLNESTSEPVMLGELEDPSPVDILFKKTLSSIAVADSLKFLLKTTSKFSTGNTSDLDRVHKSFLKMVYSKARDLHVSKESIFKVLKAAGIYTPAGLGNTLASEADKLAAHGFSYERVKEGRSRDKHRIEGERLIKSGKYNHGEEIDLDYNGDGFDDCEGNVVVRTHDGDGPMIMYGYNGKFISNDVRNIYAYETGLPYMWCSGIQLEKWKRCDDYKKRSCSRDKSDIF